MVHHLFIIYAACGKFSVNQYFIYLPLIGCFLVCTKKCCYSSFYVFFILQVFLLHPPIWVSEGDELKVSFFMKRSNENHRLMEVEFGCEINQPSGKLHQQPFTNKFYIEWRWNSHRRIYIHVVEEVCADIFLVWCLR